MDETRSGDNELDSRVGNLEGKMEMVTDRVCDLEDRLDRVEDALRSDIVSLRSELSGKLTNIETNLNGRLSTIEENITTTMRETLRSWPPGAIYLILALIGIAGAVIYLVH